MAAEETDAYLVRLFRQMETSFPDALVTDWESLAGANAGGLRLVLSGT